MSQGTLAPAQALRLLIVDDHQLLREGIKRHIEKQQGIELCGEASSGQDAVRLAQELQPDVVLLDVALPGMSGVEAARKIAQACPSARIIALSAFGDDSTVRAMLEAGACGYVLKTAIFDELLEAVHKATRSNLCLSRQVLDALDEPRSHGLSPREIEVLRFIANGDALKVIASKLNLSTKTVETHRRSIMDKLNIDSNAGLTRYAIQKGLAQL